MAAVVTLGDINLDIIARLARYPAPGGDGLAEEAAVCGGGSAANAALALARFGVATRLVACVGRDALAEQVLAELGEAGVDLGAIQRDATETTGTMFIAVTPDGQRTMFGIRGANVRLNPDRLDESLFAGARLLHLSGYALLEEPQRTAARRALALARRAGCPVSLDPGTAVARQQRKLIVELLPEVALFLPNAIEAQELTGEQDAQRAAARLLEHGVGVVGLKLGPRGCVVGTAGEAFSLPPFAIDAQDSTGAGDAFDAGLIMGYLRGWPWRPSAWLANALGALTASRLGAGRNLPGPDEAQTFLRARLGPPERREEIEELLALLNAKRNTKRKT